MKKKKDLIWACSVDIGKKNFSFCVEVFDKNELLEIENIPEKLRYEENGTPTEKMSSVLDQVFSNGKIVLHKNVDLTENCDKKAKLDTETFHNMTDLLDKYVKYWDKCSLIVIEEQMAFGKKINLTAIKLAQHCQSYFFFKYGRYKPVLSFPAYHKTQILGCEKVEGKKCKNGKTRWKAQEKGYRKKWSVNKCIEILTCRGEMEVLDSLTSVAKKDDLADVVCQLQSAKYLIYVDKKL